MRYAKTSRAQGCMFSLAPMIDDVFLGSASNAVWQMNCADETTSVLFNEKLRKLQANLSIF
ncbi:MAG: hypothetical protein LC637_12365 [Xanthomonadaceae bacterium]|nr:hypothetical protein [Xanthomonadaceae bacterium]